MAAPPAGRARRTDSKPAVASSAIPAPCTPRAGSRTIWLGAMATRIDPASSTAAPSMAVGFGPALSTSQAAGRLVNSLPAKKTEKMSPAPAALKPKESRIVGNVGETISTHQYAKKRTSNATANGKAWSRDADAVVSNARSSPCSRNHALCHQSLCQRPIRRSILRPDSPQGQSPCHRRLPFAAWVSCVLNRQPDFPLSLPCVMRSTIASPSRGQSWR